MSLQDKAIDVVIGQIQGFLKPTDAERAAAFELFVELASRTTTTTLTPGTGLIREALTSLYQMFDITREILRKHGGDVAKGRGDGNVTLAVIALRVLNEIVRPVTSKWHPLLKDWEDQREQLDRSVTPYAWERRWAQAEDCRRELNAMRTSIRAYMDTLARIAGASALSDVVVPVPPAAPISQVTLERAAIAPAGAAPRAQMVRWFDPIEGLRTTRAKLRNRPVRAAVLVGAEVAAAIDPIRYTAPDGESFWIDYVSDMGDAFDPTAAVAWQLTRSSIVLPDDRAKELPQPPGPLPRGRLLVLGGDEAYPFATPERYQQQLVLPYQLAAQALAKGDVSSPDAADVVAIPGNHDWYGGIALFDALFVTATRFAETWTAVQQQRWWSIQLPHGWWMWGIDTALDDTLDAAQVEYFEKAAALLDADDRVILCSPVPLWQVRQKREEAYFELRGTLDGLIRNAKARMPLFLAGDSHFFAHYERTDGLSAEDHITAGGGGAFLQPTHNLPEQIPFERGTADFKLTQRWPRPADSRSLAPGIGGVRDRQFRWIIAIAALLHAAYGGLVSVRWAALVEGDVPDGDAKDVAWWTIAAWPGWSVLVLVLGAMVMTTIANSRESQLSSGAKKYGVIHGVAQAALMVGVATAARVIGPDAWWWRFVVAPIVGGVLSTALFVWMVRWINSQTKANDTLAFASGHLTRFKHFLRMCIDGDGNLTVYAIGVDPVGAGWFPALTTEGSTIPPYDPAGTPRLHYVWGKKISGPCAVDDTAPVRTAEG